ncbi:MAG: hypothetical protein M1834_006743 [Cirrosporium novae-zelandiae]|nr:MAG: hypothetical protein M1834_006743 [Cirrosporium novae-zelandiae]
MAAATAETQPAMSLRLSPTNNSNKNIPQTLPFSLDSYPKLSREQAGHLRHFHNLATQIDGEWRHMGIQDPGHEFLDAYRYQLATMVYASGVAHYHRLPALRTTFKLLIRQLIHKMLRREVWGYWYNTSQSGKFVDPDITELRKPWADPVCRENIMYSGHLLLMTSLYAMLFDEGEFEQEGSIVFNWNPIFWGMGPEAFRYDNRSLQGAIIAEMERNGWVGVCCEPNMVFVVCSQFPIIAMRYNDVRDGTNFVDTVLEKYSAAIKAKHMLNPTGLHADWYRVKQGSTSQAGDIGFTAWTNAFMNSWNSSAVYSAYESQALGFLTTISNNNETILNSPVVASHLKKLIDNENADPSSPSTLAHARDLSRSDPKTKSRFYKKPILGYVVQWLSEVGKQQELDSLLHHADTHQHPSWENGGLYYPRNDGGDEIDMWTHMDPFSGNAGIGYARLNVKDGQKVMWEHPRTREELAGEPWIDGSEGLGSGVDFLRGVWDQGRRAMVLSMRTWDQRVVAMDLVFRGLEGGVWGVYVDGLLVQREVVGGGKGDVKVTASVGFEGVDVVVMKVEVDVDVDV